VLPLDGSEEPVEEALLLLKLSKVLAGPALCAIMVSKVCTSSFDTGLNSARRLAFSLAESDLITRRAIGLLHAQRPGQFTLPLYGDVMASFEDQIVRLRIRKDELWHLPYASISFVGLKHDIRISAKRSDKML
jgi:hypothetical protein